MQVDPPDLGFFPTAVRLLRVWREQWRLVLLGLVCAMATTGLSLTIPILIRHVIDYATWGFVWPVVLAVTLTTRRWAAVASIGGTLAVFGLAYAVGPPSMIEWAAQGIQLNRLLLQTLVAAVPLIAGLGTPARLVPAAGGALISRASEP